MQPPLRLLPLRRMLACLAVALPMALAAAPSNPPPPDGIALAVVFDTSGSMHDSIATGTGGHDPKYRVAQRAFTSVIDRLDRFTKSPSAKPLSVGVFVFHGKNAAV